MRLAFLLLVALRPAVSAPPHPNLPLLFIANQGQASPAYRFMAKGDGVTAFFGRAETIYQTHGTSIGLRFVGTTGPTTIEGVDRIATEVNFLRGAEGESRIGVPVYRGMAYRNVYTGIDLVYSGSGRQLKSEFIVAPGVDPARIHVEYTGAERVWIGEDGGLNVHAGRRQIHENAPIIYQIREGQQVRVDGAFEVLGNVVGFSIGAWDSTLPLIIDPLVYVTLLGGSGSDAALAMALDGTGAAYVSGFTSSFNMPTVNPSQPSSAGGNEVFVAKLNPAGNALIYCTYIGGRGDDRALGIAVDASGAAYVTGFTTSSDFPTRGPLQATSGGGKDAFILKLNAAGNGLIYSTYLGGSASDTAHGIAIDSAGNAYVAGDTTSANLPVNQLQTQLRGAADGFVAKLSADGSRLVYCTFLGGSLDEHATSIAVDGAGQAVVTGSTSSFNFPVANAHQGLSGGGQDAFLAKLSAGGDALMFSTYLGGSGGILGAMEQASAVAIDAQGNIYIAGETSSADFPVRGAGQAANAGWQDVFAAKFTASGALVYSTYLGGVNLDAADAIAVDATGAAYVAGSTASPTLMSLPAAQGGTGGYDGFVLKLTPAGNAVAFLMILSSTSSDNVSAVVVDAAMNVYAAGYTLSPSFPGINGAQLINAGDQGVFVLKWAAVSTVAVGVVPGSATLYASQTQQFTASVSGTSTTAVTWSLTPTVGSIAAGLYTAPAVVTSAQTVTVTTTSVADPSKFATATVTLLPTSSGTNLALGGVATQSSTIAAAANAIDGNTDGNFTHGSVTHTGYDAYAWWQVDLGASATINSVAIWNRTDGSSPRLGDYWVFVSNTPFTTADTPATLQSRAATWSSHQTSIPSPSTTLAVNVQGRYLRIQLSGPNYLHLAEVQVFGVWLGANLALGKTATQSSTIAAAANAIDGNTDGNFTHGSVTHTGYDAYAWWQVDLGASATINSVAIWNRTDGSSPRLGDYWVFVSNTPFTTADTPATLQSRAATWSSHQTSIPNPSTTLAVNVQGRYLRIQLSGPNYLHLAEVQVFGVWLGANLALGKTATQSSTIAAAANAIDGNTDGNFTHGSVTHTGYDAYAWWQVDLGASATINSVAIWNRTDGSSPRLGDYWVFVSNTPFTTADTPATLQSRAATWSSHQTSIPSPSTTLAVNVQGRYLRIQLSGPNYLHLAEVQITGQP